MHFDNYQYTDKQIILECICVHVIYTVTSRGLILRNGDKRLYPEYYRRKSLKVIYCTFRNGIFEKV